MMSTRPAKQRAGRIAQRLTTYGPDERLTDITADITTDPSARQRLEVIAAPLFVARARSAGEVLYPQLGGRTADRVSVMVVIEQRLDAGQGDPRVVTRTLDVRLRLSQGSWTFDAIESIGGDPPKNPPPLSPAGKAVLADSRIKLPDSARWDIERGMVSEQLLETMLAMATRMPYSVAVLSSGHPHGVFGTERISNHTRGRAVDVYAVDGELVVNQRTEGTPAFKLTQWLFESGVPELGSPWDFDPPGGRSFTDVVHADHIHVGFHR